MEMSEEMNLADLDNDLEDDFDDDEEALSEEEEYDLLEDRIPETNPRKVRALFTKDKVALKADLEELINLVNKIHSELVLLKNKKPDSIDVYFHVDEGGTLPIKAHPTDAGFDLVAAGDFLVYPNNTTAVETKVYMEVPVGYEVQIRPRSGLAFKHSLTVTNAPGTVDAGYVGEIKVLLTTLSTSSYQVKKGDKVAQAVYVKLPNVNVVPSPFDSVAEFQEHFNTARGGNGFGSTGK
jgi:dUTP pyrophosphatase